MAWRLLATILILPGTALVLVPGVILWLTADPASGVRLAGLASFDFWLGVGAGALGLALAVWTVRLFAVKGQGTPAPWDPPQKLVVAGPYRHVRNPIISAVMLMLFAESLLLQSPPIAGWLIVFFIINGVYFPLSEEKALERRFGDDYRRYKAHVPRWVPRLTPWIDTGAAAGKGEGETT